MQLTDAFCLFNRARGSELITPDDMVTACELWPKLKLKLTMAKLGSGVNVIQSAEITEEKVGQVMIVSTLLVLLVLISADPALCLPPRSSGSCSR